jgi:putative membrane protein
VVEWLVGLVTGGWPIGPDLHGLFFALLIVEAIVFPIVSAVLRFMPLRLALTPSATRGRRVRRRAVNYFRVGAERRTAERVGILLYLSLGERRAEIVADEAIHTAVAPERWGDAMAALIAEVREGRAAEGMAAAVAQIGAILGESFPKTASDVNELPDRLNEL